MFIAQALKATNKDNWRWFMGFVVIFLACQGLGGLPYMAVLIYDQYQQYGDLSFIEKLEGPAYITNALSNNTTFFLMLLSFVVGMVFWWIWVRYVHGMTMVQATTSRKSFDWKRVFLAFGVVGMFSVITTYLGYVMVPQDFVWNYNPDKFWILAIIAIALVPIQTTWEELFFRSYMMQGLGVLTKNRAVPFVLTSVIFGMLHIFNPEVAVMGYSVMFWYVGTGFLLGIFTLMDEGTELAVGFHAANNLFIALLVTSDWTAFQTDSLLIDISDPSVELVTFIPLVTYYPLLILLFAKVYKWTGWRNKLFGPIS
jgi:hypothetical protein